MHDTQTLPLDGTVSLPRENLNGKSQLARDLQSVEVGDICEVVWEDAWENSDLDIDTTQWCANYEVRTVGVLRRKDPVVSLSTDTLHPADGYRSVTHIPLPYIRRIIRHGRPAQI